MNEHKFEPTPLTVFKRARQLLAAPANWTQSPSYSNPGCWCIYGAVRCAVLERAPGEYGSFMLNSKQAKLASECTRLLLEQLGKRLWADSVFELEIWNDTRGRKHEDVLWLLDRTIAALEASQVVTP